MSLVLKLLELRFPYRLHSNIIALLGDLLEYVDQLQHIFFNQRLGVVHLREFVICFQCLHRAPFSINVSSERELLLPGKLQSRRRSLRFSQAVRWNS